MNSANRVIKNTGILYARMAITVFISLYTTRLILGALGVADFGIFNVVAGVIAMLTFLNAAMAGATQRFMSFAEGAGNLGRVKQIFNISLVLHIIIAILVLVLLEVVGYFLFHGILKIPAARMDVAKLVFQFMIVSTLFTIISVPYDAIINAHENMLLFALISILEAILKLVIAIYIIYTSYDKLIVYGLLMAALSIFLLIVRRIYCHKKYPECEINIRSHFNKSIFREMTGFAGWSFLGSSSSMVSSYGQGIIMNMFFGTVVNAAQGISAQVSGQLGAFAVTMLKALNPIIDKSEGGGNRELMLKASIIGSKISFFLLLFFYVPVLIEMPYIFKLWLKTVPDFVIIFCRLLLIRNLIEHLGITLTSSIAAVGNIKKPQIVASLLNFLPLIITYIFFTFKYPPYTLYIVFLIYSLLNLTQVLYFAHKICGLSIVGYFNQVVVKCGLLLLLMICFSIIPTYILNPGIFRLLSVSIISTFIFIISIWWVGFSKIERHIAIKIKTSVLEKLNIRR